MFTIKPGRFSSGCIKAVLYLCIIAISGCAGMDPAKVDVQLEEKDPEVKVTSYTPMLNQLGLMTEIYDTGVVKIQSQDISDNTGSSAHTGGEIQRNITEIVKSTLNSMGGNVVFIEYDPAYIQNQTVTGYSDFTNKLIPDVVITGGITEFDRGLETRGEGTDFGASAEISGAPDFLPTSEVAVRYGDDTKYGIARITLDFNMKNFQTLAGIAKMNTVYSIEVGKALGKREYGVTLFGATFGKKGSVKKVQGRHEAVRLLVQASMIQMVGKYLVLPYWRLLGDDAITDDVVMSALTRSYYNMDSVQRMTLLQEWLYLHGYDVRFSGNLDAPTEAALRAISSNYRPGSGEISVDLFTRIYTTIPIDYTTLSRRQAITNWYLSLQSTQPTAVEPQPAPPAVAETVPVQEPVQPAQAAPSAVKQTTDKKPAASPPAQVPTEVADAAPLPVAASTKATETASNVTTVATEPAKKPASVATTLQRSGMSSRGKIGRMLDEDDW